MEEYYDRKQLARLCGVKLRQTYNWTDDGELPEPDKVIGLKHFWLKTNQAIVALIEKYKAKK